MFESTILEVAIGLAFLFCMLSLAAATLRECIEGLLKTRAVMLERGIRELVSDPANDAEFVKSLFDHPSISGLFNGAYPKLIPYRWKKSLGNRAPLGGSLPSYIPSRTFATGLIDRIARGAVSVGDEQTSVDVSPVDFDRLRVSVAAMTTMPRLQRSLLMRLDEANGDIERARRSIEAWYDNAMDRVSGWYRRETQGILFAIGLLIAILLNIDAIAVGQRLLVDQSWRDSIVAAASSPIAQAPAGKEASAGSALSSSPVAPIDHLEATLGDHGFMIGAPIVPAHIDIPPTWGVCPEHCRTQSHVWIGLIAAIPGYLIVALATSLGAPFWFDVLNKLMVIRSTIKPHEKSGDEASKDKTSASGTPPDPDKAPDPDKTAAAPEPPAPSKASLTDDDYQILDLDPTGRPREGDE